MKQREPEAEKIIIPWKERIHALFQRYKYALLVVAAGIAMMVLPALTASEQQEPQQQSVQEVEFETKELEGRLEEALAQDVKHSVREEQSESSQSTVVISRGSGNQEPVVIQQLSPQFQGALVICSGGYDTSVRLRVVEAVGALTGLGADKISVSKGK